MIPHPTPDPDALRAAIRTLEARVRALIADGRHA